MESLLHRRHDVLHARHEIAVLRDRQRDAGDVGFLKGVVANQLARHLAGDADHRHRVHHGGGNPGHQVRGPRARRGDGDADASSRSGIPVSHMGRALLVPHEHVPHGIVEHGVIGRQDGPAGITEDRA